MKYLKGPVYSRRLGRSLGIDLLPQNICSEDCLYCECGPTQVLTRERKEYVPAAEVKNEIAQVLARKPETDFITFSGRGEPTLNSKIGEIISFIKESYPDYQVALLTNSTLLKDQQLQQELRELDLLVPSLDAGREETFQKICRPAASITLEDLVTGILETKNLLQGKLWLEILLIKDLNDGLAEIQALIELVEKIEPERVDLNTINRGPAYPGYQALTTEELTELAKKFPGDVRTFT